MCERLQGSVVVEHTLARRGAEKLWELLHTEAFRSDARRAHRQPGGAAGESGIESDLSQRLAGCGGRESRRTNVSRPKSLSGEQRSGSSKTDQPGVATRRPNRSRRRQRRHRLVRSDRRRCGSRLWRSAQCFRIDEGNDRSRRGRGSFRRSARERKEMRTHGRQSARPNATRHRASHRSAAGGRCFQCADHHYRAHRCERGGAPHQRCR